MPQPNCSRETVIGKKSVDKKILELCHKRNCFYCGVLPSLKIQGTGESEHASWQAAAVLVAERLDRAACSPDLAGAASSC